MPGTARPLVAVLASAVLLTALAGCGAPAPADEPDAAPTPSPTSEQPVPVETDAPATLEVVVAGDGLEVREGDATLLELPYTTSGPEAVSRLAEALGAQPTTDTISDDACYPVLDEASFGGLHLFTSPDGLRKPAGAQFYVTADDAEAAADVPIVITTGQSIGDEASDVLAANAEAPSFANGDWTDVHYDVVSGTADGEPADYYGAYAQLEDDELAFVTAPTFYFYEC
jgi:predicted small lipoprotein YifL